jgi:hypothetical protein
MFMFTKKVIILAGTVVILASLSMASGPDRLRDKLSSPILDPVDRLQDEPISLMRTTRRSGRERSMLELEDVGGIHGRNAVTGERKLWDVFSDLIANSKKNSSNFARIQATLDGLFNYYAPEEIYRNLSSSCIVWLLPPLEIFFELIEGVLGAITATNIYDLGDSKACTLTHLVSRIICAVTAGVSLASAAGAARSIKRYLCSAIADKRQSDMELLDVASVSQDDELVIRQVASHVAQYMSQIRADLNDNDKSMLVVLQKLIDAPAKGTKCGIPATITINILSILAGVARAVMEVAKKNAMSTKFATIASYAFESASTVSIQSNAHYRIEGNARLAMMVYITNHFVDYMKNRRASV